MFNKIIHSIGGSTLIILFISIILINILILIEAYAGLRDSQNSIKYVMEEMSHNLKTKNTISVIEQKKYIDALESKSKTTLDSSTISFLFEIFTISLISAGVYLLSKSHEELRKIKNEASIAIKRDKSNQETLVLLSNISESFLIINNGINDQYLFKNHGYFLRDQSKNILEELYKRYHKKYGFEENIKNLLLDRVTLILEKINGYSASPVDTPEDIIKYYEKIKKLLSKDVWTKWYDKMNNK